MPLFRSWPDHPSPWYLGDRLTEPKIADVVCHQRTVQRVAAALWAKAPARQMLMRDARYYYPEDYDRFLEDSFLGWGREHRRMAEDYIYEADEAIQVVMRQLEREGVNVY